MVATQDYLENLEITRRLKIVLKKKSTNKLLVTLRLLSHAEPPRLHYLSIRVYYTYIVIVCPSARVCIIFGELEIISPIE